MNMFCETEGAVNCSELVRSNRANITHAYWQAWENDVRAPIVVVLDLQDENSLAMARSRFRQRARIQTFVDECTEKKVVPTAILAMDHDDALKAMTRVGESARKALFSTIPRSYFRIMTFAFGEHTHTAYPEPNRDEK